MDKQPSPTPRSGAPSLLFAPPEALARGLLLLSRILLLILALSVLVALIPYQPWDPLWWARLGPILIDYSPGLILAIALSLLASYGATQDRELQGRLHIAQKRVTTLTLTAYGLLLPIQLTSLGWYWLDSGNQLKSRITQAEIRIAEVRQRIGAARSLEALSTALGQSALSPQTSLRTLPLDEGKRQLKEALGTEENRLINGLRRQRHQRLVELVVSTIRVVLSAGLVGLGMAGVKLLLLL